MSLDDSVQDLADRLGTPLVVLDLELKVVAYSIHDTAVRRARLGRLLAGSAAPVTDSVVRVHGLRTATHPVRVPAYANHEALVVTPLRHDKRPLGYLYFVDDRPSPGRSAAEEASALESACPEIAMLLSLKLAEARHSGEHSRFVLAALLGDSVVERRHAAATLLQEGLIEDVDQYSVLVFRAPDLAPRSVTRLAVEETLEFTSRSTTVKIVGAVLGTDGIVLFPRPVNKTRLGQILASADLEQVTAGVGGVKRSLNEAVDSFHEAQIACRASTLDARRYGRVAFWDDLGLDRLLLQLPLDRLTPNDLPPGVQRLLAAPNGRELASTLETYLDNGGEVQRTAQHLNVHRSTLYYRLDRIREVTGCELSDGVTRLDLHAGLRVARLSALWLRG